MRPPAPPANPTARADRLVAFAAGRLEDFADRYAPGFALPGALGGHVVDPDTRADLAYTLGWLGAAGATDIAGVGVADAVATVLAGVHGPRTNPFSAYRVAETLLRAGPFDDTNPWVAPLDDTARRNLDAACDARGWLPLLDGLLPANYAIVLARMARRRRDLGLAIDDDAEADLLGRMRALFDAATVTGFLDDSGAAGVGRYDIYSADAHLFAEPFAAELGERWREGLRANVALAELAGATNGAAFVWGRSTGLLSVCMTVELGAIALREGLTDEPARWLARIDEAIDALDGWFADGLTTAHRHRSPYGYRGPARRLQLTFDALGKLVVAAVDLRAAPGAGDPVELAGTDVHPPVDELVRFSTETTASVWVHRDRDLAFVLPCVGAVRSDYLPAPVNPGLLEVPVDSAIAGAVPTLWRGDRRHVPAGPPTAIEHEPGRLTIEHEGFPAAGDSFDSPVGEILAGTRRATYRVAGRSLTVEEHLHLPGPRPQAVTIQVTEAEHRPLHLDVATEHPHTVATVDVRGIKDHRSFWGELPRVHQVDLAPATDIHLTWRLTPKLRLLSSESHHQYHRELYRHLGDRVAVGQLPTGRIDDPRAMDAALRHVDQLHLHWPEWTTGPDPARLDRLLEALDRNDVRIVWTMHNLRAHAVADSEPLYRRWARSAHLVLHHSDWGRDRALATYEYGPGTRHVVLPHVHWGAALADAGIPERDEAEARLGLAPLPPGGVRLGVVGAPRREKDVQLVLDAFAATHRDDLRLVVFSLDGETVPDDPRIDARPYTYVSAAAYATQLATLDALVLPFAPDGMLTTGTVGDAVALGLPSIASGWPFLAEILGDAAITYGTSAAELRACLHSLDADALAAAAGAARALRDTYDPATIGPRLGDELDRLGTAKL